MTLSSSAPSSHHRFPSLLLAAAFCLATISSTVTTTLAFVPTSPLQPRDGLSVSRQSRGTLSPPGGPLHATFSPSTLLASPPSLPNPFRRLPWNVEREQKRRARRLRLERSALHRELGIAEDATYEEIVAATGELIERAGSDMKRKIKVEIAKDKILQIRLNERLAGLTDVTTEAKAQSSYEYDGNELDDDLLPKKKVAKDWNAPKWTQGLIVKPDEKHIKGQVRLWGIITMIGVGLPPAISYLNRFSWLVCIAQLSFRGMSRDLQEGGGLSMNFGSGPGAKSHLKVAWLLGLAVSFVGAIFVYGLMPAWAKGQRYTPLLAFTLRNAIYGVACSYLQPYKG